MDELATACQYGNITKVKKLLEEGADPNSKSALAWASCCGYGYPKIVKLLLECGADPDSQNALYVAAAHNQLEVVKILLEHGASPFRIKDKVDKVETICYLIQNNLLDSETIEKNKHKIPKEVWSKIYE